MSFAENVAKGRAQNYPPTMHGDKPRQAFHHAKTSVGAAGHWIHLATVAAPLIIGEVVKDPDTRWRALRLTSVAAALASEAIWVHRLSKDKRKDEETQAALSACAGNSR